MPMGNTLLSSKEKQNFIGGGVRLLFKGGFILNKETSKNKIGSECGCPYKFCSQFAEDMTYMQNSDFVEYFA